MTTIITDSKELADMIETFDVSQPSFEERCSDGPCDEPVILQTFDGPAVGLCHFWGCPSCALLVGVSYVAHEPHWLDGEGTRAWVETPKQVIHLWIPEAGITSCGIGPGGEAMESGDGPVTCDACLYEDAFPAGL